MGMPVSARLSISLVVLLFLPLAAQAQAPADSAVVRDSARAPAAPPADTLRPMRVRMPELTVEADRSSLPAAPAGARSARIDSASIARSGAASLSDLLALRSGAFVKQHGDAGLSALSMRGTGAAQTVVLLDGMRMSDPQTGQVDLSLLPTLLLESVEVRHGPASARFGSGSLGGSVRLRTIRASHAPLLQAQVGSGAFGERRGSAVVSGRSGSWSGIAAGRHHRSDGDFRYRNRFLFPAQTVRRQGADARFTTFYGRGTWRPADSSAAARRPRPRWSVASWITRAERGLPGPASAGAGGARQWDRLGRTWVEGTVPLRSGPLSGSTVRVRAQGQASVLRYINPPTQTRRTSRTHAADASVRLRLPPGPRWTASVGGSVGYDRSSLRGGVDRLSTAAFAEGAVTAGRVRLEPAVRVDAARGSRRSSVALAPRLGASVRPLAGVPLRLKGLVARAFRRPTFNELYYDPGGTPGLAAEDGYSAEVGAEGTLQRAGLTAHAEATAFVQRRTNRIVWRPSYVSGGVQVWSPANVGRARTRGLEVSVRGQAQAGEAALQGGMVFTHTRAENRSNPRSPAFGAQLPYVPRQQLKAWVGGDWQGLSVGATGRLVGSRYYSADESNALPPYHVVDLNADYRFSLAGTRLSVGLQVENLTNERYQIIRLYPMPPRRLSGHLTLSLSS
jgi:iron complex outermembrane receptor protein